MIKLQRILCPTDFSPTAAHAVNYAAELARTFGAELVLLHSIPELNYPLRSFGMASSFPHLREELHTRAREALEAEKARGCQGANARIELRDGESSEQILAAVHEMKADMVVMGTHGHTGIRHAIMGSTAEKIVRLCECPVLTVRFRE